jgi:oxygen-dependent protoporphyrinogen oxidase
VELFEASDRLGGVLSTERVGDLLIELGADSFITKQPWAVELCEELGIADELIPTNTQHRRALVWQGDRLHPVPEGFVLIRPQQVGSILKTSLLSWRGKIRLLAERWRRPPRSIEGTNFDDNLARFASKRLGRETFERLVEPLVAGIYTADATKLSVAATMPDAIEVLRKHHTLWHPKENDQEVASGARYGSFVTPRGGVGQLVDALVDGLAENNSESPSPKHSRGGGCEIRLERTASLISGDSDKDWWIDFSNAASEGPFAGVVVALPTPQAAPIVYNIDPELSELLVSISYASSAIVCAAFRKDQIAREIDGFGFVVPAAEQRQIIAASFSSIKFPGRAPEDTVLVRIFLGGALRPELVEIPDEELTRLALGELQKAIGTRGEPLHLEVQRWREKMPQYHVGHVQLVDDIERHVDQHPGLALAGNGYRGVGIPYCVRSGDLAARRVAERFLT